MSEVKERPDTVADHTVAPESPRLAPGLRLVSDRNIALAGVFLTACTVGAFWFAPAIVRLSVGSRPITPDNFDYSVLLARLKIILPGLLLSVWLLVPSFESAAEWLRSRWRTSYTVAALLLTCGVLSVFIIHFGNRQFGSWDMGIMIDTGWRQILGQRPYTDFITPNPPGFNLGIKYAFELFGVNWNAQLYFTAFFTSLSFLWAFWLLWRLTSSRLSGFCMALVLESMTMLPLCYWWYNNTVAVVAALFFLSCLFYAKQPESSAAQVSYVLTLAVVVLMKPNIAGLAAICGILFLIVSIDRRPRLLLLTLGSAVLTLLILYFNRVSIPAMIADYRAAAIERGGFSRFGLIGVTRAGEIQLLGWTLVAGAPLFSLILPTWKQLQNRNWRIVALYLYLATTLPIALYGMATDGEIKGVECGMLLCAGGVIAFGLRLPGPVARRFFVAVVIAASASGIYMGVIRLRVLGIAPHKFFEWRTGDHPVPDKFFKDMRGTPLMLDTIREARAAKSSNPGPFYFGPGMEFAYALLRVPSPLHLPVYWQVGTSFARKDEPRLLEVWKQQHFQTLIFIKGYYPYYSRALLAVINRDYEKDDSYPVISVYHPRKP